jgi:hypothetical protein
VCGFVLRIDSITLLADQLALCGQRSTDMQILSSDE